MKIDLAIILGANIFAASFILYDRYMAYKSKHPINYLQSINQLSNQYIIIRHGESMANTMKIISSDSDIATVCHGLTPTGRQQVQLTAVQLQQLIQYQNKIMIYTSDFLRAVETTNIIATHLRIHKQNVHITPELRERGFGSYNDTSDSNYELVWCNDLNDADHTINHVESVNHVIERTSKLIAELERKHCKSTILLVAHGDVLQIIQTMFDRIDGSQHRSLRHLTPAEARVLSLQPLNDDVT